MKGFITRNLHVKYDKSTVNGAALVSYAQFINMCVFLYYMVAIYNVHKKESS